VNVGDVWISEVGNGALAEIRGTQLLPKRKKTREARSRAGLCDHFIRLVRAGCSNPSTLQTRKSGGRRRQAAVVSSAITSAIVRWFPKVQLSPAGTSRAAIAASTCRQAPCAGKPITASRTREQAPQLLQVASEYVAGQIAIRLPAGVYRGNEAVRSRHSPIVSAQ
jgi:hypothetical protein